MKAIIFAGGIGTRLWPLSRQNTPKQFEKIINNKSTLQLAVDRLRPEFDWKDIYISTGQKYFQIVKKQLPQLPSTNFILEPETRDVAPAIGLAMIHLRKHHHQDEPVAILWSDHLLEKVTNFKTAIKFAGEYIKKNDDKFVFIGQTPRFASENLGWIEIDHQIEKKGQLELYQFKSWHYHPPKNLAEKYFTDDHHVWNVGYFVVKPRLVLNYYQKLAPTFYSHLTEIEKNIGQENYWKTLQDHYHQLEKTSFDSLILERVEPEKGVVIKVELGWTDIGTWDSLWEVLKKDSKQNLKRGKIITFRVKDSLLYNYEKNKLVVAVGLGKMVIVNTDDVILVCPQDSAPQVKKVVKELQKEKKYVKYT